MANFLDFEKLVIHNFGSYGHTELDLKDRGFCLVSGQNNFKKDNALSNGSGKSFIWSAICFTITGETLTGLHTNLKNINIEDDNTCYTKLIFKVNNDEYEIIRTVAPKTDLQVIKNGTDVSGKTFRESEKKLGELLPDLTKDLIASTIIIGQGMPNKFSSFSPSGRKELLEKLTKSDFMIEDIKARVDARQQELGAKIRACEDSLLLSRNKLAEAQRLLKEAEDEINNAVKPDFDKDIEASDKQIKSINEDITKLAENKKLAEEALEQAREAALSVGLEKQKALTKLSEDYNTAISPVKADQLEAKTTIQALTNEVNRAKAVKDVCPMCGQKLPDVHKPNTEVQEKEIQRLTESLKPIEERINQIEAGKVNYLKQINDEYANKETQANAEFNKIKKDVNRLIDEINDDTQSLNVEKERYNKLVLEKNNWDTHQKALANTVAELNKSITQLTNIINLTDTNKADLDEHLAVVKKMESLAKRDFRGYLLTNIINYIDKKAKDYSEIVFETRDLNVYIDGNALDISYGGKMFDNLSGGEKQRVDLILQFAIRDMLNVYLNSNANILVLDEITDFLDKQSCAAIMKLIEKELTTIESVFIVSHHASELEIPVDSEIKVVKNTDGISQII